MEHARRTRRICIRYSAEKGFGFGLITDHYNSKPMEPIAATGLVVLVALRFITSSSAAWPSPHPPLRLNLVSAPPARRPTCRPNSPTRRALAMQRQQNGILVG